MPRILLDAGHGGADAGAVYGRLLEKGDNITMVYKIKYHLERNGVGVDLTRKDDTFISLGQRVAIEKTGNYDYFVSIHRDAFKPETAKGVTSYSLSTTGKGRELAEKIQPRLVKYFTNRGCKTANYYVLKYTRCPAVLLELGFIDNTGDNKIFLEHINDIAIEITKGILEQLGMNYKDEYSNNPIPNPAPEKPFYRIVADGKQVSAVREINNLLIDVEILIVHGATTITISKVVPK